jgi:hypothetical protein
VRILPALGFLLAAAAGLGANDYVVAPHGADTNPGTADAPFRTLQKAAQVLKPGDSCYVRTGVYRETVTPARSGTAEAPIVFRAFPGEKPVVSGADPVAGWALHKGKVHKAAMPWTRNTADRKAGMDQVFVDGEMVAEARWPNIAVNPAAITRDQLARAESGAIVKPGSKEGEAATSRYVAKALKDFQADYWKGACIFFMPGALWCGVTGDVTASTPDSVTFTYNWLSPETFYNTREKDFFFLWGKLEALDTPGEWYRDPSGVLYLWPPRGDDPGRHLVEAKKRDLCFDLRGKAYVTIDGLGIFAGGVETDERSAGVILDGVEAKYVGHALWYRGWWSLATEVCVSLRGPDSAIRNSTVGYAAGHAVSLRGARGQAVNNIIHDAGYVTNGCNVTTTGEGFLVAQNTLRGTGNQTCLDLSRTAKSRAVYNDISHSGRLIIDEAAVWVARDTDGQGTEIAYNTIHDTHAPADGKDYFGNGAIYLEGRVKNVLVHHNVMWNISGPGVYLPGVEGEFAGVQVFNNSSAADFNLLKPAGVTLRNNVFGAFQFDRVPPGDQESNATFRKQYPNVPFLKDPGFADLAAFDFRLRPGSPLIDRGVPVPPHTDGFAGRAPDVGAYESGRPTFVTGAVVADRHLPLLRLSYTGPPSGSTVFTLADLPPGRKPPSDFKLKIGENEAGGEISWKDGAWTVRGVPCKGSPSSATVSAVIGGGKPVPLKKAASPPRRP